MLVFEPFLQAVISFDGSVIPSEETLPAYLSRSEGLDVGKYFVDLAFWVDDSFPHLPNMPGWFRPMGFTPDLGFVSALYSGFYNSRAAGIQTASSACPTANCSWTPFTTSAICNECHNVSSYMERREQGYTVQWALPEIGLTNLKDPPINSGNTLVSAGRLNNSQHTLSFKNLTTMITAVQVIRASEDYEKGGVRWADTNVTATECALYFCINAYNSSMKQGKLEEVLIGSWSERDPTSYADISGEGDSHETQLFDEWNNHSFYCADKFNTMRSDLRLLVPEGDVQRLHLPEKVTTSFNLTTNTVGSLVSYLNEEFFSGIMVWPPQTYLITQKPVAQALWSNNASISDTFNNVARSLTSWMRDASNTPHRGEIQEWAITVRIEWKYTMPPLLAFAQGVLFCLFIFWETGRLGLPPWKTGMIATLTHSLNVTTREQLRNASMDGSLDKIAKATVVQLEDTGSGLEMKAKRI